MSNFVYLEKLLKIVEKIVPPSRVMVLSSTKNVFYPKNSAFINAMPDQFDISENFYNLVRKNIQLQTENNEYSVNKIKTMIHALTSLTSQLDDMKASQKGSRLDKRVYFVNLINKQALYGSMEHCLTNNQELINLIIAIYETNQKEKMNEKVLLQLCKDLNKKYGG